MDELNKIEELIAYGEELLNTYQLPDTLYAVARLDHKMFSRWKIQCENFLKPYKTYEQAFTKVVKSTSKSDVESGLGILEGLKEDIDSNQVTKDTFSISSSETETNKSIQDIMDIRNTTTTPKSQKAIKKIKELLLISTIEEADIDEIRFKKLLQARFDKGELKELCFELGEEVEVINFEKGLHEIAMEMVSYFKRRNRLRDLFNVAYEKRDHLIDEFLKCRKDRK